MKARNMSFAMTPDQIIAETKTVTRRDGWLKVKAGDYLRPVDRVMGFKKGQRPRPLLRRGRLIRVTAACREPLRWITADDVAREGFPELTPAEFIARYRKHGDRAKDGKVTRIAFEYVDDPDAA